MTVLPRGTVTFLFTDIEGSTRLWEEHPESMRIALARHDALIRQEIERHDGYIFKTVGDAFCAAFHTAPNALQAALCAQLALDSEPWPGSLSLAVRMALHSGGVEVRDNDYFGQPLNRISRLLATSHGGQVLMSAVTQELVRDGLPLACSLQSLGEHRLRDLGRSETVFQLQHPDRPNEFPPLKSLDNPQLPNNLPLQVTSFIGREKEIAEVAGLLEKTSLLTLIGAGGSGKTRLALQIAADALETYSDGVWLVELASLHDGSLVTATVAKALGISEQAGQSLRQTLVQSLKGKRLLLLLDNCEHLLPECSAVLSGIMRACPNVKVLTTSREALGIGGEQTYRVPSLSLPDPKQPAIPESLGQYEAVRLFIERARLVKPDFEINTQNAPALAQICVRLDGIPLAIELASARVRSLQIEDINSRLDNRFRLLKGGDRSALPRQQTLRALIDWSYELLSESEKLLLSRLAVFAGGWTLLSAEQICAGEEIEYWEVLDLLTGLADKSLVMAEELPGVTRFRFLETVRQYAMERLQESGEIDQMNTRHRDVFLALAEEAEPELVAGPKQQSWLERLESEHDNLRAALACSSAKETDAMEDLRLTSALARFWFVRGHWSEGRQHLDRVLGGKGLPLATAAVRAKALNGSGILAYRLGDYPAARSSFTECLRVHRESGNKIGAANMLSNLGLVAGDQGEFPLSRSLYDECLPMHRELGNKIGLANATNNFGLIALSHGDFTAAKSLLEESLPLHKELGNKAGVANVLSNLITVMLHQEDYSSARSMVDEGTKLYTELGDQAGIAQMLGQSGDVAYCQGDHASARSFYEQALRLERELGAKRSIADRLEWIARVLLAEREALRATLLFGVGAELRSTIGIPRPPREIDEHRMQLAKATAALGQEAFDAAWEEGKHLSWEQAVDLGVRN